MSKPYKIPGSQRALLPAPMTVPGHLAHRLIGAKKRAPEGEPAAFLAAPTALVKPGQRRADPVGILVSGRRAGSFGLVVAGLRHKINYIVGARARDHDWEDRLKVLNNLGHHLGFQHDTLVKTMIEVVVNDREDLWFRDEVARLLELNGGIGICLEIIDDFINNNQVSGELQNALDALYQIFYFASYRRGQGNAARGIPEIFRNWYEATPANRDGEHLRLTLLKAAFVLEDHGLFNDHPEAEIEALFAWVFAQLGTMIRTTAEESIGSQALSLIHFNVIHPEICDREIEPQLRAAISNLDTPWPLKALIVSHYLAHYEERAQVFLASLVSDPDGIDSQRFDHFETLFDNDPEFAMTIIAALVKHDGRDEDERKIIRSLERKFTSLLVDNEMGTLFREWVAIRSQARVHAATVAREKAIEEYEN